METDHIREFMVLAEQCNYREAAERLFISQTALFKHIKALEREIGAPLFTKSGKHIVISEYGQLFLPYASQMLKSADQYLREADARKNDTASVVLIGTQYRITDLVMDFLRQNDRYLLRTIEGGEAADFLYRDGCELAFICDLDDPEGRYNALPYAADNLAAVMHPSHPLAKRKSVTLQELRHEKFVTMPTANSDDDMGLKKCREAGFLPKIVMTAAPGSEVARLAGQGVGIALLNKRIVQALVKNAVTVDVTPLVEFYVSLCWRKDVKLSMGARAFVAYVKARGDERYGRGSAPGPAKGATAPLESRS